MATRASVSASLGSFDQTASAYVGQAQTARNEAQAAAAEAAFYAQINAALAYDFNLGGATSDADWNL